MSDAGDVGGKELGRLSVGRSGLDSNVIDNGRTGAKGASYAGLLIRFGDCNAGYP